MKKPDLSRARYEAFKLTKRYAISAPDDIRLDDIVMDLGIFVREEHLSGAEARLLRKGKSGVITISDAFSNPGRKRFSLAHEMGHWQLHDLALQSCTEKDLLGISLKALEAEANTFAATFLMPTCLIESRCKNAQPDLNLICELAEKFKTTVTATALRFVEECRFPCTVVFSENNKVAWSRHGGAEGSRWPEAGWDINDKSTASDSPAGVSRKKRIDPDYWFAEYSLPREIALFEQSLPLGRYGIVITLLSFEDRVEPEDNGASWSRSLGRSRMRRG